MKPWNYRGFVTTVIWGAKIKRHPDDNTYLKAVLRNSVYPKALLSLLFVFVVLPALQNASAQTTVNVTGGTPCFLTAKDAWVWRDCGYKQDWLEAIILPWEWISGGYFSMIVVAIFVMFSYIKYHKMIYPLMVGAMFLPISYFLFPETFLIWAFIMAFVGIGLTIAYIILKQTKEY